MTQVKYNLFAEGGDNYAKYRPNYPDELFETVLAFAEGSSVGDGDSSSGKAGFERKLCADIATGNGQAAISLVNYFDKVIGVEPSASQLEAAIKHDRIEYRQGSAEDTKLPDGSVDLVTVAQAFHWFDFPKFFAEAKRIMKPQGKGVLAVWGYNLSLFPDSEEAQQRLMKLYNGTLGDKYWSDRRKLVDDEYNSIEFPFDNVKRLRIISEKMMSIRDYVRYLSTWSSINKYYKENPNKEPDILVEMEEDLVKIFKAKDAEHEVRVQWPIFVVLARDNQ